MFVVLSHPVQVFCYSSLNGSTIEYVDRIKKLSKRELLLPECRAGSLVLSCLQTQPEKSDLLRSQGCQLSDSKYTIRSPWSPACQLQILGFLSLHNHISQFFIIKVLFLWRTLTSTDKIHSTNTVNQEHVRGEITFQSRY